MKNDQRLDLLINEARQARGPDVDFDALEAKMMARIEANEAPRFPSAIPSRSPRPWVVGAAGVMALAAGLALVWRGSLPSPVVPPVAVTPGATMAPSPAATAEALDGGEQGRSFERPGLATLWLEPHSHGLLQPGTDQLRFELTQGAVSLDVQPQPSPDRVSVQAGKIRVSVKGTKFRVAYVVGHVDVDVEHGAVLVTSSDDSSTLLRGPAGGTFALAAPGSPVGGALGSPSRDYRPFALGASSIAIAPSAPSFAGGGLHPGAPAVIASAPTGAAAPAQTVAGGPSHGVKGALPPVPSPVPAVMNEKDLKNRAYDIVSACLNASSNVALGVSISIETTLTVEVDSTGKIDGFSFAPPVAPAVEQCFQRSKAQLRGPTGRHALPMSLTLGGR